MNRTRALLLIAGLLVMGARPAQAQFDNVGSFEFPTSASGEVQHHFLRAAALLHSFGWLQAIEGVPCGSGDRPGLRDGVLG